MRSILEKAIVHVLNEENEQADALFHRFVIERAKQIHESYRQGDDAVLDETWDDDMTEEESYTEDDLSDLDSEDSDVDESDVDSDDEDVDTEMSDEDDDLNFDDEDDMDSVDADDMDAPVSEDDIAEIKDQLEALYAKVAQLDGSDDTIDSSELPNMEDDVDDIETDDADIADDENAIDDEEHDEEEHVEDEHDDEDDFADLAESIASELQKVNIDMTTDGREVGSGKSIQGNDKSVLPSKEPKMTDAKPVSWVNDDHVGYDREQAPSSKMVKKSRNVLGKSTETMKSVGKEGDKNAMINKDFAGSNKK